MAETGKAGAAGAGRGHGKMEFDGRTPGPYAFSDAPCGTCAHLAYHLTVLLAENERLKTLLGLSRNPFLNPFLNAVYPNLNVRAAADTLSEVSANTVAGANAAWAAAARRSNADNNAMEYDAGGYARSSDTV
ncbi:hypothetical protein PUNSTDRAFT_139560 [Punctularia strigosozonata HHB-11173 SS5]|uniref:Uncharacterized protein n=1 Tax=Punctularia strigosozonata (strain HHB-11173) TaxID=741275 RepID=R7S0Q2_PUNST|nr:uncharacterized protein PUNSTDRAFT_139560 [Punctularia strigosozonata HHB-11173 SS5]EIN03429.1 hypothetical protein PUNSTDRAFT_139560 [Punctularia strigosozonata HHB-11173 SS5]